MSSISLHIQQLPQTTAAYIGTFPFGYATTPSPPCNHLHILYTCVPIACLLLFRFLFFSLIFSEVFRSTWTCTSCGKWYKHKDSLRRHTREECGKMPRHQCHICHALFYHRHNLKTHSISKHKLII